MAAQPGYSSVTTRVCDALAVLAATAFVVWKLHPELLVLPTITTGGDTASHYYAAWWLRHELLPQGRLSGWMPGNYAGFPLFQVYFPLPFVLMAALSLLTGLPVAFKLITAAGLIGLPLAAYLGFRSLRFAFPAPALAAVFTLPFLFHEADSMWGANVGSTLAGEFTYAFATALLLVFVGTLYRGVVSGRGWIGNALLLAAIALSHAYTVLVAAALGAYLVLFHPRGREALPYLVKVATLAFALIAFWAFPLLAYAEYTTAYSIVWPINGFSHVFPSILWPALVLLAFGATAATWGRWRRARLPGRAAGFDHRVGYLASLVAGGLFFYLVAWKLDVVDIRFLPFVQLTLSLLAALPATAILRRLTTRRRRVVPEALALAVLVLTLATLVWVHVNVGFVDDWAAWNYRGFEATPGWAAFREVNDAVRRSSADPRVAYEHSMSHDEAGSVRAFESLPFFSGASTLEGLYMQSTISSPFVFYIQSEISQIASCPLLPYHCARLDAERAAEHLRLFNVTEVISRGDRVKEELDASPAFAPVVDVPPYRVFRVAGADGAYVVPLRFEPLVIAGEHWKRDFFAWFKRPGSGEVPLVRAEPGREPPPSWERIEALPDRVPRRALPRGVEVDADVGTERIRIHTSRPGHPLLVKVSYHPRWRVDGADAVWLASPSFMLLLPTQAEVTLTYGRSAVDYWGLAVSWLAVLTVPAALVGRRLATRPGRPRRPGRRPLWSHAGESVAAKGSLSGLLDVAFRYRPLWAAVLVVALASGAIAVRLAWVDPWVPHRQGLALFHDGEYVAAEPLLLHSIETGPSSSAAYYSTYYHALCAYRTRRWEETLQRFEDFIRDYPDGELVPEADFRIAEALQGVGRIDDAAAQFLRVLDAYPTTYWAQLSAQRLATIASAAGGGRDSGATGAGDR
jgi:hypothetical protein